MHVTADRNLEVVDVNIGCGSHLGVSGGGLVVGSRRRAADISVATGFILALLRAGPEAILDR
jgi:hypothetical protein